MPWLRLGEAAQPRQFQGRAPACESQAQDRCPPKMEDEAVDPTPEPQPRRSRKAAAEEAEPAKPRRSRKAAEQPRESDEAAPAPKRGRPKKAVELEPAEVRFASSRGERSFQARKPKKETGQYYGMHHPQPSALHRAQSTRQAAFDAILSSW